MARRIMHFYAHESCGWCIPCQKEPPGCAKCWSASAGLGRTEDIDLLEELAKNMLGRTFCRLATPQLAPSASCRNSAANLKTICTAAALAKPPKRFGCPLEKHERTEISHVQINDRELHCPPARW
jgi:hypothetical protein